MNLDLTIHRMAFREARSLGVAQVLVAQKRAEFDNKLTLEQANAGRAASQGQLERMLADMRLVSDQSVKANEHRVDRLA